MKAPSLTLGIEEEYQVVDPETGELRSYITQILKDGRITVEDVKPELHQSVLEVGSSICHTPSEIREEVVRLRTAVIGLAAREDLKILAAGTHPFSSWMEQEITPLERYMGVAENLQELAKRNLIFGMHVHVGIEDQEFLIDAMKVARYFLPHILALSTSSPFWMGRNTGLKSYRSVAFRNFPRTGIPPAFDTYANYDHILHTLVNANCIPDASKIWWDIRPHSTFPTLEFRICDCVTKLNDAMAIAALIQALVAKLIQFRQSNQTWRKYRRSLIVENKWRACKNGIEGSLIDFGKEKEIPFRTLMEEMLILIDDVVDPLGSRQEIEHIRTILNNGTSADRQITCYEKTGSFTAVLDQLCEETLEGC